MRWAAAQRVAPLHWFSSFRLRFPAAAMHYVAPVGEQDGYVQRGVANVTPYL